MSDDDELDVSKIDQVVDILKQHEPSILYPNAGLEPGQFLSLTPYHPAGIHSIPPVHFDTVIKLQSDLEKLVISRLLSFISCCVVKRVISNNNIPPSQFFGTGIFQDFLVYSALKTDATAYLISSQLIRPGEKDSYSPWFLDSCIFGVRQFYQQPSISYNSQYKESLAWNTTLFGLSILRGKNKSTIPVEYENTGIKFWAKLFRIYHLRTIVILLRWMINRL